MKKSCIKIYLIISIILVLSAVILCACEEEPAAKSGFGEIDALSDGAVLVDTDAADSDTPDDDTQESGITTSDSMTKTSVQLNVDNLVPQVRRMVALCDAINMTCVEQQKAYDTKDNNFVWHCVHLYVANCTDKAMGFTRGDGYVDADPDIVLDIMYAMFGKITDVPNIPFDMKDDEEGPEHVRISNNLKYRFSLGDRGTSTSEVRAATQYSDGSLEMEVALIDSESRDEVVSFIYTMRANTRNTTTSAIFDYEITGVRPADRKTSDRISGIPFLVPVIQIYGYDSYDRDDPKYNEVEEVLYFNSFSDEDEQMDVLNERIEHEIREYANSPVDDVSWHEICSYPLTTDEYVQAAVTYITYPTYAEDPDLRSYNYSKKERRAMDENDALGLCGMTEAELYDRIKEIWKPLSPAESLTNVTYKGFMVRTDGSVDIYLTINVNNTEAEPYSRLIIYNSTTGEYKYAFDGEGLLPIDGEDAMKPKLTHGRRN